MDDYRCEASNKYGDVWSDVTLTVSSGLFRYYCNYKKICLIAHTPEVSEMQGPTAPSFVKPLQEVHAQEGAPAELECVVKGEPLPTLKWFKASSAMSMILFFYCLF